MIDTDNFVIPEDAQFIDGSFDVEPILVEAVEPFNQPDEVFDCLFTA